uniref:DUF7887 domain-containing protein n=1 Tax=Nelumbo nucifera TaxID=4432 RepID=A0A822ZR89_NELNU|nr:TPA_asm: hypothetical protein HUJ06_003686 [Nelumbo nucifera]
MLVTERSFITSSNFSPYLLFQNRNGKRFKLKPASARKRDSTEKLGTQREPIFPLRVSNVLLARSAVAVFGLGFVDAGGDWSRIGVISKENEELLKIASFIVVPLCLILIFSFSKQAEEA